MSGGRLNFKVNEWLESRLVECIVYCEEQIGKWIMYGWWENEKIHTKKKNRRNPKH